MTSPSLFNQLLIWPILNILIGFYKLFEFLRFPGPLGFAIISLTVAIRLALHPLTAAQIKSAKKMQALKPHLDKLNRTHGQDKMRLQKEQMRLYQEHGLNPAAGCLPLLLQFPVLISLYNVFFNVLSYKDMGPLAADINKVMFTPLLNISRLDLNFLGVSLVVRPAQWQSAGAYLLIIPVITAVLQWMQAKVMMPVSQQTTNNKQQTTKKDEKKGDDFQAAMQKQMEYFMPLMIGFFAFNFPAGLALYWNTFSVFGIIQQVSVGGWGSLEPQINKIKKTSVFMK